MTKTRIITVLGDTVSCTGVAPMQCLQVKKGNKTELFYASIAGFSPVSGHAYRLLVKEDKIENPPADGSSLSYTLIRMLSKRPKSIDNPLLGNWTLIQYNSTAITDT
jgi:hypothetical protein